MKRLALDNPSLIDRACEILHNSGIIVYPTDTLYGFGVDATNPKAIDKVNRLKGRTGPVSVIAPDIRTAKAWIKCTETEWSIIKEKLGGPTTVIVPVVDAIVHDSVLGPRHTLGIRIPQQPVILELVKQFGKPVTTTSVNRSGLPALNNPDQILSEFDRECDLLIDAGPLPPSKGSHIYRLQDGELKVLR